MEVKRFTPLVPFFSAWGHELDGESFISTEGLPWKVETTENLGSLKGKWVTWWPDRLRNSTELEQIDFAIDFLAQNGSLLSRLALQSDTRALGIQRNITVEETTAGTIVPIPDALTELLHLRKVTLHVAIGTRLLKKE